MHTRCQISTLKRKLESLTPAPTSASSSARFTPLPGDGSFKIPPIGSFFYSSARSIPPEEDEEASENRVVPSEHDDCSQAVDSQAPGF